MADQWLSALHSEPSPEFKERLRQQLRTNAAVTPGKSRSGRQALLVAAVLVGGAALMSVPAVRASASQFLSLFRVVNFVAVQVQPARLDQLHANQLEIGQLIGEQVEIVEDPGPPIAAASPEQAATAAGLDLALPQWLPDGTTIVETTVSGERVARITANAGRLQQVMDALGINDLPVPEGLDGQVVNLRVPPVVMVRYEHGGRRSRLFQARTPQLTLPESVDLQALGEIGLRILGLSAADADDFAHAIDWHTTLLVPVPPTATSFRQVNVAGSPGVVVQHHPPDQSLTTTVLWSTGDRVFSLVSIQELPQVLAMANSVR